MTPLVLNVAMAAALLSAVVSAGTAALAFLVGRSSGWRDFGRFGWVALTAAAVSTANATNTVALTAAGVAWSGRLQFLFLALHVLAWHGYVSVWARAPLGRGARWVLVAMTVLPGLAALPPGALYADTYVERPVAWLGVTYREATVTGAGGPLMVAVACAAAWALARLVRSARRGAPRALVHVAAAAVLVLLAAHDAVLTFGQPLPTPYLIDFAFYLPIAALGLVGVHRLSRSSAELAVLRDRLEARVRERTAELEAAHAALARAERLAALGQLSAGVAHEVNNPAATISANLAFVSQELGEAMPEEARAALDDARSAVRRIAALTKELHLAGQAAASPLPLEPVELAAVIEVAVQAARARGGAAIQVSAEVPPGLMVLARAGPLEQVLANVAVNAVQAIRAGQAGAVRIQALADGERVWVLVEDDGEGMAPEALRRAGEPFFSTRPAGGGAGLGLAVASGLLSAMSGSLTFESEPGRGTRARVELLRYGAAGREAPGVT